MNEQHAILKKAGIVWAVNGVGAVDIRLDDSGFEGRVARHQALMDKVVESGLQSTAILPICLVCFDAVLGVNQLEAAIKGLSKAYVYNDSLMVEWSAKSPPRVERRVLSPLTILAWQRGGAQGEADEECVVTLMTEAQRFLQSTGLYPQGADHIAQMQADACCWYLMHLPMPLWAHITGLQCLSALPQSALARQASGCVLDESINLCADAPQVSLALDAACVSCGKDEDSEPLKQLEMVLRRQKALTDSQQLKHWLQETAKLLELAQECGPVACAIVGWVFDLTESGTAYKANPAASTVQRYILVAMWRLWEAFSRLKTPIGELTRQDFEKTYQAMVDAAPGSQRKPLISALQSWHKFLVHHMDVPSIRSASLQDQEDEVAVDAQVIWAHEKQRVSQLLTVTIQGDGRLREGALTFFAIACHGPFREAEVSRLRMANVLFEVDAVDIEVAPSRKHGRLKSKESQRVVRIEDAQAIVQLRQWHQRRLQEGARPSCLLFGDPLAHEPLIYRRYEMIRCINTALKMATGCAGASIHGLRHTFLSEKAKVLLSGYAPVSINRYERLANEAGHASAVVTLTNYVHHYEQPLRTCLDRALRQGLRWTSKNAAPIVGFSDACLRQQVHRKACSLGDLVYGLLQTQCAAVEYPSVTAGIALKAFDAAAMEAAKVTVHLPSSLSVAHILKVLEDLVEGYSQDAVALRHQLAVETVRSIERLALSVGAELMRSQGHRKRASLDRQAAAPFLKETLDLLDIQLKLRHQPKYEKLAYFLARSSLSKPLIEAVVQEWMTSYRGTYWPLASDQAINAILKLWIASGANLDALRLVVPSAPEHDFVTARAVQEIAQMWQAIAGQPAQRQAFLCRASRPDFYLLCTGNPEAKNVSPASGSIKGLFAWMLGCEVWRLWNDGEVLRG